jgi:hypothetical protein
MVAFCVTGLIWITPCNVFTTSQTVKNRQLQIALAGFGSKERQGPPAQFRTKNIKAYRTKKVYRGAAFHQVQERNASNQRTLPYGYYYATGFHKSLQRLPTAPTSLLVNVSPFCLT